jgi:hypothetical protein
VKNSKCSKADSNQAVKSSLRGAQKSMQRQNTPCFTASTGRLEEMEWFAGEQNIYAHFGRFDTVIEDNSNGNRGRYDKQSVVQIKTISNNYAYRVLSRTKNAITVVSTTVAVKRYANMEPTEHKIK